MRQKICAALSATLITFGSFGAVDAATRDELAAIQVKRPSDFKFWTKNSAAKQKLLDYVKDVTDKRSANFIPLADRIAVFDMDGTLYCESAPCYVDWMFFLHRAQEFDAPEVRSFADKFRAAIDSRHVTKDLTREKNTVVFPRILFGMSVAEYDAYAKNFVDATAAEGFDNLKVGEAFYLPMIEAMSYLSENDFTIYIVSGSERELVRVLTAGLPGVKTNQIIGTDHSYVVDAENLIRGDKLRDMNIGASKISAIWREIGKQPVLAFGNSSGDFDMFRFTLRGNKYKAAAFMILCDDTEREFGNVERAASDKATAQANGWQTVSMRDDFKTIYGTGVRRVTR